MMKKFVMKLAGVPVQVAHRYDYIAELCRGYRARAIPVFGVSASEAQIDAEAARAGGQVPRDILESTCLHREIVRRLVRRGILLMHSAVIALDGTAYVFMAKSGVGKTTHIRLWQEAFGDRVTVVNGDKPLFSFEGDALMAHGSPWRGKEGLGENISMPVGGICFLERGEENAIRRASSSDVVARIFHQVLLPDNAADMATFMALMDRMAKHVPFYILECNMEREAAIVACEAMAGKET